MNRLLLIVMMVFGSIYVYAVKPLMDDHQLNAIEAHEKIVGDCMEEMKRNKKSNCLSSLAFDNNAWPIPKRGTKEFCQKQYASLSVDTLEGKFNEIEVVYETARYFSIG